MMNKPMKQHITLEQLCELEDFIGISKLTGISILRFLGGGTKAPYKDITIGKMIEIIDSNCKNFEIYPMKDTSYFDEETQELFEGKTYTVEFDKNLEVSKELTDALWLAVKAVLNETN